MSLFVDGSVYFITDEAKEDLLRKVILRADGTLIDREDLFPERSPRKRE